MNTLKNLLRTAALFVFSAIGQAAENGGISIPELPPLPEIPQQQTQAEQLQLSSNDAYSSAMNQPVDPFTGVMSPSSVPDMQLGNNNLFGTAMDPVFQDILKRQFPLSPEQIEALRRVLEETQRAQATPVSPPTPTVSTQTVTLEPGSVPPAIRMATGYVSSVVFVDSTGQPWPIANYSLGNPNAYNIQWDTSSNVLMIQGITAFEFGNMAVRLVGLDIPVMLTMVSDQDFVDYRVDLRLQGQGPNAKTLLAGTNLPDQNNPLLTDILEGIPPQNARPLTVSGGSAQAWLINNTLYLRTALTLLSPSWTAHVSSADGTQVFEMSQVTPMIIASDEGQPITLTVEDL